MKKKDYMSPDIDVVLYTGDALTTSGGPASSESSPPSEWLPGYFD